MLNTNKYIMRTPIQSMYSRLDISPNPITRKWVLNKQFIYYRGIKGSKNKIVIPKGFEFDGASLPRIFWIIGTPMRIDTLISSLIHDRVYHEQKLTRQECDELFNEVMLVTDVKTSKRILFFLGVRIGGWISYNNHKKSLQKYKK